MKPVLLTMALAVLFLAPCRAPGRLGPGIPPPIYREDAHSVNGEGDPDAGNRADLPPAYCNTAEAEGNGTDHALLPSPPSNDDSGESSSSADVVAPENPELFRHFIYSAIICPLAFYGVICFKPVITLFPFFIIVISWHYAETDPCQGRYEPLLIVLLEAVSLFILFIISLASVIGRAKTDLLRMPEPLEVGFVIAVAGKLLCAWLPKACPGEEPGERNTLDNFVFASFVFIVCLLTTFCVCSFIEVCNFYLGGKGLFPKASSYDRAVLLTEGNILFSVCFYLVLLVVRCTNNKHKYLWKQLAFIACTSLSLGTVSVAFLELGGNPSSTHALLGSPGRDIFYAFFRPGHFKSNPV